MSIEVYLTPEELQWALDVALQRIEESERLGLIPKMPYEQRSGLNTHTLGCYGELSTAKAIGIPWPARVNEFRRGLPDLDPFWEARWAHNVKSMPVKAYVDEKTPGDPPHRLVAFSTGAPPIFTVHGYVIAQWAQRNLPAVDRPIRGVYYNKPAHWVELHHLTPIDPGFHSLCMWANGYGDHVGWICIVCGKETSIAGEKGVRADDGGRPVGAPAGS